MTTPVTDTTQISQAIAQYYDKKLLTRLTPTLQMYRFGKVPLKTMPTAMGLSCIWTRFSNLAAATTALSTEGTAPSGCMLSATNVSATVAQYGDFTKITDVVSVVAISPVIEQASELFGEQAGLTIDTLIHTELANGTVQYARAKSAVSSLQTSDTLIASEIRIAVETLETANARPHSLTPGYFPMFIHPRTKYDLIGDTATGSWIDTRKYVESGQKEIELNKVTDLYGVKVFMTQNIKKVSSTYQTYNNIILSEESFGILEITELGGSASKAKIIVKQPGSAGSADPLNQVGSVGWKLAFVAKVLDSARVIVLKTGSSRN